MPDKSHLEAIHDIRSMMEKSSRFISLSGLSGISAGIIALLGALFISWYFQMPLHKDYPTLYDRILQGGRWDIDPIILTLGTACLIAILAVLAGIFFTTRKAKQNGLKIWDNKTKQLLTATFLPLLIGGLFCLILLDKGYFILVPPATLIFYGLACINASKFTYKDLKFLGISECILGLLATWFSGHGFLFWTIGFGLLHIIYGAIMYYKYER